MPTRPRSLARRIFVRLAGYALLLTGAVFAHGYLINEYAESLLWDALVRAEFDYYLHRRAEDPDYHWSDTDTRHLYVESASQPLPAPFASLPEGIHDEITMPDGRIVLAMLRRVDGERHAMTIDISDLERREDQIIALLIGSTMLLVATLGALLVLGVTRALRPLADMANAITALVPERGGQRIVTGEDASSEMIVIANALNDYLERNERFVERERGFINSASHELRTPIAVIEGAAELALQPNVSSENQRQQLQRILRTTEDMKQLVALLLALAKEPSKLTQANARIALHALLPDIVEQHRHLTRDKSLELSLSRLSPCEIDAPPGIVRAAIGNLLRNAIEHSDNGTITIHLESPATVVIEDPGHGMTPEQISAIYRRTALGAARCDSNDGGGIGLDLIMRLCEHLGWKLELDSDPQRGTTAVLRLR